jgi:hypothetical protein
LRNLFGVHSDGDYNLLVQNKTVPIYCKNMNTTQPSEYLTLKAGESQNFAEIYDKKLVDHGTCQYGPRYGAHCSYCQNETVSNHGITLFSKVRLNITGLQVVANDYSFAYAFYGSLVPFGHSGDCFSSVSDCQIVCFCFKSIF